MQANPGHFFFLFLIFLWLLFSPYSARSAELPEDMRPTRGMVLEDGRLYTVSNCVGENVARVFSEMLNRTRNLDMYLTARDAWNVLGNKRKVPLCGRYPENAWGQLKLSYCAQHFLMPGRDGAIGTAPLEMFRESSQEIEARVFIEKALEDKTRNALLGEELATRARSILDDRVRLAIRSTTLGGRDQRAILAMSVQECSEQLYGLVAEVARKLADK